MCTSSQKINYVLKVFLTVMITNKIHLMLLTESILHPPLEENCEFLYQLLKCER